MRTWKTAMCAVAALSFLAPDCGGDGGGGSGGGAGAAPPTDECAPYTGSYEGIYTLTWTCVNDPTLDGLGTINVHFTAECEGIVDGDVLLMITSYMSDNEVLGALTETPEEGFTSVMIMPQNPPAASADGHTIVLDFPGGLLGTSGTFQVSTNALQIVNAENNHDAFYVGEPARVAAGKPMNPDAGCVADSQTFAINKKTVAP
jgi:hypothetical protein